MWSGETDWFFGVASRTALGALLILPIFYWLRKEPFQYDFAALKVYFFAAMPIFGGMTLMYWAGQYLPSGWVAIIFAMTPVTTGVFAYFLLPNQPLTLQKIMAVFLVLAGLLSIFIPNIDLDLMHMQLMAIGVALIAVSFHY
ncbi:DMT family transporter [Thiomicrorhabdus sp. Milos-T2]|uniref:DMT family transporter n=1 Tax=Thiomicrorhabdus sp. Milos-T2 TaxID=90814 RepID=UPI000AD80C7D|nr:DMT family transporter [Thiomicrorhabdus sp. Milos-T2]